MPSLTLPKVPCPSVFVIWYDPMILFDLSLMSSSGKFGKSAEPWNGLAAIALTFGDASA